MNQHVLPIEPIIPELMKALDTNTSAVLIASPGAGKTTRVPLALLKEKWLEGRIILLLEPRRLAARAAAKYMAEQLGERVGETVGYRVRMDTRVGPGTRIEVITEGVLARLLQADPALEHVGLVIFDEFHERSLHADLGLALCHQAQHLLREDLRILVMSATMEAQPIAALLGNASVLTSEGRAFPVKTQYLTVKSQERIETTVVKTIVEALEHNEGDLLVFLPGAGEIRRVASGLSGNLMGSQAGSQVIIAQLHGGLSQGDQDQALAAAPAGKRKVVLATSIAETSLTVEGIQVVIDSGLMRVPRFSPRTGMTRLETVPVSLASADQRRGRAGRLGPGVCYRLWTEQGNRQLMPRGTPEIKDADLASLVLELAAWGVCDPSELSWLDPPPTGAYLQAQALLIQLAALNQDGTITKHGKQIAEMGLHPRLAHMILQAVPLALGNMACELAALLSERDFLRGGVPARSVDLRTRLELLHTYAAKGDHSAQQLDMEHQVDTALCRRILVEAAQWKKELGISRDTHPDHAACGLLLAFAYPDRIAQRRTTGKFLLSNGRGAVITELQPLSNTPYLVAADLDDYGLESRMYLAAPVEAADLQKYLQEIVQEESLITWDRQMQSVKARQRQRLGALILKEIPHPDPDPLDILQALFDGLREEGLQLLPWTRAATQLRERLHFMHQFSPDWPDVSEVSLIDTLAEWLGDHLYGLKNRGDLQKLNLFMILEGMLSWQQRQQLETYAPTHLTVPSGSRIPVDYSDPASPALSVRLQEMFGLADTPRIAGGKVALTLRLLSPAQRPVQVTRDLSSFWRDAYFEVKKDLKGRYPKHYWPDDPLAATPTQRAKPRV
ncbi:ATP-dependent helicase HrpB [Paenibacillus eucommiae]|uniref:ATP-dependent helicase HrpB n=1 Tax=Paenibacillus eucommiae TaxID=1355755 RepID=A0ABS4IR78_9BACL|nr:ATP-dependent helicase HrpB [Paenibacillus eucommiae]MBP1990077.1 ATP-dependent helicase HrpB [Paenibacillus eucommiae]